MSGPLFTSACRAAGGSPPPCSRPKQGWRLFHVTCCSHHHGYLKDGEGTGKAKHLLRAESGSEFCVQQKLSKKYFLLFHFFKLVGSAVCIFIPESMLCVLFLFLCGLYLVNQ